MSSSSIIVLIIASSSNIYDLFLELWREKIKCWKWRESSQLYSVVYRFFFVFADPSLNMDVVCKDDCIYCKCDECLEPGIFLKTMMAIRYCEDEFQYDFILRTNLSSFWNFSILSLEIQSNPDISIGNICLQIIDRNKLHINYRWKYYLEIIDSFFPIRDTFIFLDGAGFLLSREMIRLLFLPFPCLELLLNIPDDVAISILLFNHISSKIEIHELLVEKKCVYGSQNMLSESVGFVRNKNVDDNRILDIFNFKNLIAHFYLKN
jgi:hypothetical protein